jgi:hypothetical protein
MYYPERWRRVVIAGASSEAWETWAVERERVGEGGELEMLCGEDDL